MAKKNKIKVPKRVLGIKLPRDLRKNVKSLARLIRAPETRQLLGAAIAAVAANRALADDAPDKKSRSTGSVRRS